jgi:hypothetical protein
MARRSSLTHKFFTSENPSITSTGGAWPDIQNRLAHNELTILSQMPQMALKIIQHEKSILPQPKSQAQWSH